MAEEKDICKEVLGEQGVPPALCPECIPNPAYIEPNILYADGTYYNERTCSVVHVFDALNTVEGVFSLQEGYGDLQQYILEHIVIDEMYEPDADVVVRIRETEFVRGIKRLCLDVNKAPTAKDLERLKKAAGLEYQAVVEGGIIKIRISISKSELNNLPPYTSSNEPEEALASGEDEIILDATKFIGMTTRVGFSFKIYKKFYQRHLLYGGYLYRLDDPNKKVICPTNWLKGPSFMNGNHFPSNWININN